MSAPYDKITSYPGTTDVGIYMRIASETTGELWNGSTMEAWLDANVDNYDVGATFLGGGLYGHNIPAGLPSGDNYTARFYKRSAVDAAATTADLKLPDEWPFRWTGTAAVAPDDSTRPVIWDEAKKQILLLDDTDQTYVESLIDACSAFAQRRLGCSLMQQTRTHTIYLGQALQLPYGPVISVTSITDDNAAAITGFTLERIGNLDRLNITQGFKYPLTVVYEAGFATRASIPADIRQAILMHVSTLYQTRESITDKAMIPVPHALEMFYHYNSRLSGVA